MSKLEDFLKENQIEYNENVSFKTLTTYHCGATAKYVVIPDSLKQLTKLLDFIKVNNIKYKIFGNGSNILASDKDYDGIIIKLAKFNNYSIDENNILVIGAGCNLSVIANKLSRQGYSGLEFACGIPGTIGGAIYMNAGAYLKDMSSVLIDITIIDEDCNIRVLTKEDLKCSYRKTILSDKPYICLQARIQLEKNDVDKIITLIDDRMARRLSSQPLEYPSAGSVFRNPDGDYAGRLIEECNLKGKIIGGGMISDKHANFIVNKDNASAKDIKDLIDLAHTEVKKKFNVDLHLEQELFNWE